MEKDPNNKDDEIILFQEGGDDSSGNPSKSNNGEESESNQEEYITNEEFLLECARFGDLEELKNALKSTAINYFKYRPMFLLRPRFYEAIFKTYIERGNNG